jgi:hypothetical protein
MDNKQQQEPNYIPSTATSNKYVDVYQSLPYGESRKIGEILTLGDANPATNTKSDKTNYYSRYGIHIEPKNKMSCGGYTKVEYSEKAVRCVSSIIGLNYGVQLIDIFASNTNCLVLVIETPDRQQHEPEFMVLIRPGMCQSNGAIYWKNKPVSPWYADRCAETDDVLLARKFTDLTELSWAFDRVYEHLDRGTFKLID